jgi:hypothetical protein
MKTKQFIKSTLLSTAIASGFFYMAVSSGQEETENKVEEKLKTQKPIIV